MGKPGRITDLQSRASSCCLHSLPGRNRIDNGSRYPGILASQKIPAKTIRHHYRWKIIIIISSQKNRGYFLRGLSKTTKNREKSRKTAIVAEEMAVFCARMAHMKTSSTKMLENRGRSRLRSGYLPRFCLDCVADITKKAVRNELLFRCSPRGSNPGPQH